MTTNEYKLQVVWEIKDETFMNINEGHTISSDKFDTTLPYLQYSIDLTAYDTWNEVVVNFFFRGKKYPNGDSDDDNDNVSFHEMNLSISSANFQSDLLQSDGMKINLSRSVLLNLNNNYFVNHTLKLEVRGILSYKRFQFCPGNALWEKEDKDFKFIVGNESIMAHKLVIRGISSIFDAAMNSGEFDVGDFGFFVVQDAIKLCYGCNTFEYKFYEKNGRMSCEPNDLVNLIKFADVYNMHSIKEHLENECEAIIASENVCELANKSLELKAQILRTFCVNFLSNCIKTGKPFKGTLKDLNPEIALLVFNSSFCHSQTS